MLALAFFALSVTVFGCAGWGARVRPERPPREAVADHPTAYCLPHRIEWKKVFANDTMDDWIGAGAPARRGHREQGDDPLHPAEQQRPEVPWFRTAARAVNRSSARRRSPSTRPQTRSETAHP